LAVLAEGADSNDNSKAWILDELTYAEAGNLPGERLPVLGVGDGVHQWVQGGRHFRCNKK
jgi:hypothetical protein